MIFPTVSASGVTGCGLITTLPDATEVHSIELVTLNVYVPASRPVTNFVAPAPVEVAPPGNLVNIQVPVEGKPLNATLPVAMVQVGEVIVPIIGAVGQQRDGLLFEA